MLQQYYDGLTVNNVVMTNENPLLIVDNKERINYVLENGSNLPIQEGAHINMEVYKQHHFNYNHNR
jgi:hypothetical protein